MKPGVSSRSVAMPSSRPAGQACGQEAAVGTDVGEPQEQVVLGRRGPVPVGAVDRRERTDPRRHHLGCQRAEQAGSHGDDDAGRPTLSAHQSTDGPEGATQVVDVGPDVDVVLLGPVGGAGLVEDPGLRCSHRSCGGHPRNVQERNRRRAEVGTRGASVLDVGATSEIATDALRPSRCERIDTMPLDAPSLKIGPIEVIPPVVLAPMAGVTDAPFRVLCSEFGRGSVRQPDGHGPGPAREPPQLVGADPLPPGEKIRSLQLYGTEPHSLGEAVRILVGDGLVDHIDMNFGCPAAKVTRNGGGAALPVKRKLLADDRAGRGRRRRRRLRRRGAGDGEVPPRRRRRPPDVSRHRPDRRGRRGRGRRAARPDRAAALRPSARTGTPSPN